MNETYTANTSQIVVTKGESWRLNVRTLLGPDPKAVQDFLARLGNDVVFCTNVPDNKGMFGLRGPEALDQALKRNGNGHNIYYVVNVVKEFTVKKPTKEEIVTIRAVWADLDWDRVQYKGNFDAGLVEIQKKQGALEALPSPPSLIIHTGGGLQPLWFIEPLSNTPDNTQRAEAVSRYIEQRFDGDPVGEISRILRAPGFVNHPKSDKREAGQRTELAKVVFDSGRLYKLEELERDWSVDRRIVNRSRSGNKSGTEVLFDWPEDIGPPPCGLEDIPDDDISSYGETELSDLISVGTRLAEIPNGPLSKREGWLVLLFVCTGLADCYPHLEPIFKQAYHDISEMAGGSTEDNEIQWNNTIGRTEERRRRCKPVLTIGSLFHMLPSQEVGTSSGEFELPSDARADSLPDTSELEETEPAPQITQPGSPSHGRFIDCSGTSRASLTKVLPHRRWLIGTELVEGEISLFAAPGGRGKTSYAIALACEAASGKKLIGHHVFGGPHNVLYLSGEDSKDELERRLQSFAKHHNLTQADLDRIDYRGAASGKITFTTAGEKVFGLSDSGFDLLTQIVERTRPKIMVIDPLTTFIPAGLNDNGLMAQVILDLKKLAGRFHTAILIIHHTRKDADLSSTEAIGGASAIVNQARVADLVLPMTREEARGFPRVSDEFWRYFRIVNGKSNFAPPKTNDDWFELKSVNLNNPEPPIYPNPDSVQVVVKADPQAMLNKALASSPHDKAILKLVAEAEASGNLLSPSNRGKDNTRSIYKCAEKKLRELGVSASQDSLALRVERVVKSLEGRNLIVEGEFKDAHRRPRKCVRVTQEGRRVLSGEDELTNNSEGETSSEQL